ncbi:MAG: hypothetical protein ACRDVE_08720 [Actinocrinis sp.]
MTDTELPQTPQTPQSSQTPEPSPFASPSQDSPLQAGPTQAGPTQAGPTQTVPAFGMAPLIFVDPVALEAERVARAQRAAGRRRNALRWTSAIVATLVIGGGIGWAISTPKRTDIPGLKTAADGRYDFPALTMPTLPADQPAPAASDNTDAQRHLADIRKLLLPKPTGATAVGGNGGGWLADPSKLFVAHDSAKMYFAQFGLRHAATEGWKTADGATTTIYLLQFTDGKAATAVSGKLTDSDLTVEQGPALSLALAGVPSGATAHLLNLHLADMAADETTVKADGKVTRYGSIINGDTVGIIIQSGAADLPQAPFTQVVTLQAQMLQ